MSFREDVIKQIQRVPKGRVTTYGAVASLAGKPRAAQAVGQILHNIDICKQNIPWQRVINSKGYISTNCFDHPAIMQAELLRQEGVKVEEGRSRFSINLKEYLWLI